MSLAMQIAVVIALLAFVAVLGVVARTLVRLQALLDQAGDTLRRTDAVLEQTRESAARVESTLVSLDEAVRTMRGSADQINAVVHRSTAIAGAVLNQVEPPVRQVVALLQGIRAGLGALERWWVGAPDAGTSSSEGDSHGTSDEHRRPNGRGDFAGGGDRRGVGAAVRSGVGADDPPADW